MAETRELPIKWMVPDGMHAQFANHFLVTHVDGQFVLTFFEAVFPIVLEGDEEAVDKLTDVPAHAICRLAVPPEKIQSMIKALSRNYERYEEEASSEDQKD